MAGIYIHIPFCKQACYYCDFHFSTYSELKPQLLKAIETEIQLQKLYLNGEVLETIYFGGGTPSILEIAELEKLLESIYLNFTVGKNIEITIEANPDDLNVEKTKALIKTGFNRLSIGIQSFNDDTLDFIHRAHTAKDGFKAIHHAQIAGFENINLDLIFAITENRLTVIKNDIKEIIQIQPQHISTYSLTIEPNTVFGNWNSKGKIKEVSSEYAAMEYEYIMDTLCAHGYDHYEISNFASPGFISRHNSNYWKQIPYLGIGPSAHSYNGATRQSNVNNNSKYIKSLEKKIIPAEMDYLSRADRINEQLLTGLRTKWGVDLVKITDTFKVDIEMYNKSYIQNLIDLNLATFYNGILQLTKKGMSIADKICSDLFYIDKNDGGS